MKKILLSLIFILLVLAVPAYAEETVEDFAKKAATGDIEAQIQLGESYFCGWNGAKKDEKKAYECFKKLEEQGNAVGQYYIGYMYWSGVSVAKDFKKAVEYLEKAALQGEKRAQSHLAMMYSEGNDITQNYVLAYAYYNASIDSYAKDPMEKKMMTESRDKLKLMMTPAQIKEAEAKYQELAKAVEANKAKK